jgi:putative ABC transport system ATP-binding protein
MKDELIKVEEISKLYDKNTRALNGVTLSFNSGSWSSITGPSGSGKTTLLNIIGCLDSPTDGNVTIDNKKITGLNQKELTKFRREHIGLIFQQYHLIPYLNALENVMVAQYYHSVVEEVQAIEVLKKVGLDHRLMHLPSQLSGGEQQRVCIARALINEPEILLADEPTGNLDQKNGKIVLDLIKNLNKEGHTIILITHNPEIAKLGDRCINLIDGKIDFDKKIGAI